MYGNRLNAVNHNTIADRIPKIPPTIIDIVIMIAFFIVLPPFYKKACIFREDKRKRLYQEPLTNLTMDLIILVKNQTKKPTIRVIKTHFSISFNAFSIVIISFP